MTIDKIVQSSEKVKPKTSEKSFKQGKPPTITVTLRTYKNDVERLEKLRLFCESLHMKRGGVTL